MESEGRLVEVRAMIDAALEQHLASAEVAAHFAWVEPGFLEELRGFVLAGGKRFRPLLLAQAWEVFGGEARAPREAMLGAAVAVELFHAFLLIHDDIMDRAEVRRHRPTLRARLQARWGGSREGEGDHLAIVLGDVCFALALELLNGLEASPGQVRAVVGATLGYAAQTGMGQLLDLLHGSGGLGSVSAASIERCYDLKTARYTIECPLKLGALLGGAPPETIARLERFSRALGVAYQLADDLIGVATSKEEKSGVSDFEEGRQTVLLAETLARVSEADRAWLEARFGGGALDEGSCEALLRLYGGSGAVEAVHQHIRRLAQEARDAASGFEGRERALLLGLISQLLPG